MFEDALKPCCPSRILRSLAYLVSVDQLSCFFKGRTETVRSGVKRCEIRFLPSGRITEMIFLFRADLAMFVEMLRWRLKLGEVESLVSDAKSAVSRLETGQSCAPAAAVVDSLRDHGWTFHIDRGGRTDSPSPGLPFAAPGSQACAPRNQHAPASPATRALRNVTRTSSPQFLASDSLESAEKALR
ncbi:hypothetical protein CPSG_04292 [Coccidioides posadasii str. Silveira]|uniref:Uncharacterized protein n=1 Tax=Coccidioides posadasii (strain RMSCC 757 / Silveira) TaxID=443226 RepID=E9D3V3_COCPS|nr:hypothetical protein CPSG_04292 [Coccidioides posadasii str. Silveira]